MKLKKYLAALTASLTLLSLAACGSEEPQNPDEKVYTVGVCQLAEHPALDEATRGFQEALSEKLGDRVQFDIQNAQGEQTNCTTIINKFVSAHVDLIMGNATNAVKAAREATSEIPIVGTSVTDYVASGLVAANEAPGENLTGVSDSNPVSMQVELLKKLCPEAKTVGIVHCSGEENSALQAEEAKAAFEAAGCTVKIYTVADSNEIQPVVTKACTEVDAFYEPSDNLIASNVSTMANVTTAAGKPVFTSVDSMCRDGFLATYSINYYDLGHVAGEMAADILLGGKNPAEMPIYFFDAESLTLVVNEANAKELGVDLSPVLG